MTGAPAAAPYSRARRRSPSGRRRRRPPPARSIDPRKTKRPSSSRIASSHAAATSSTRWVDTTTQASRPSSRSSARKVTRCSGSSPAVGSSSSRIRGSLTIAWAIPTRRTMPPESVFRRPVGHVAEPDAVERPLDRAGDRGAAASPSATPGTRRTRAPCSADRTRSSAAGSRCAGGSRAGRRRRRCRPGAASPPCGRVTVASAFIEGRLARAVGAEQPVHARVEHAGRAVDGEVAARAHGRAGRPRSPSRASSLRPPVLLLA